MAIDSILSNYQNKFKTKEFNEVLETSDLLMDLFKIDPLVKRQNMQYWSRELGMCWQRLVVDVAKSHRTFGPPIRWGEDEPCDLVMGKTAIDTKYRVGSGDSGTLKKLKDYARQLTEQGYVPVMLILRTDNLQSSVDACESGGWKIYTGQDSFKFIERRCGIDLQAMLTAKLLQCRDQVQVTQLAPAGSFLNIQSTPLATLTASMPVVPMATQDVNCVTPTPPTECTPIFPGFSRVSPLTRLAELPNFTKTSLSREPEPPVA